MWALAAITRGLAEPDRGAGRRPPEGWPLRLVGVVAGRGFGPARSAVAGRLGPLQPTRMAATLTTTRRQPILQVHPLSSTTSSPITRSGPATGHGARPPQGTFAAESVTGQEASGATAIPPSCGVEVWRRQAEHLADSLTKGDRVMVTGRLRQRSWETPEGDKRSVTEIEADEVGASLKFATAKVERTSQRGNGDRTQGRERGGDFDDAPPTY
jgi:single-stranded DNA-binding protein